MVPDRLPLSLSCPNTHWLPGSQARAALHPSSDRLCLEGSGGDGKSPAPFSHAALTAAAPRNSDLCVCRWLSTLGPVVNFSCGCCGTELSFEYLLSAQNFLQGSTPTVFFPFPFSFSECAGIVAASEATLQ